MIKLEYFNLDVNYKKLETEIRNIGYSPQYGENEQGLKYLHVFYFKNNKTESEVRLEVDNIIENHTKEELEIVSESEQRLRDIESAIGDFMTIEGVMQ